MCTLLIFAVSLVATSATAQEKDKEENPMIVLETTLGKIEVELYADKAPVTVKNFVWYVENKFYDGLIFHRVIPDFMIQGGGFNLKMVQKEGNAPIKNEATNGLGNDRGTIAMARTSVINSATSQFFINLKDNAFLNHRDNSQAGYGYAVFGKVTKGLDVVDKIAKVETQSHMGYDDVPVDPVVIEKAYMAGKEKKK
ncbi:MAG: peptidyl-prolyl cis-trans isomerase [Candidatus Latescibacteria bacterium]|nr:peptidyl-prolyl cis-trans isomerase [Candidatus Latescibacterota bacterium]NIM21768.1 peptidyl-prolyl cis-trans isomerase [Candidatus Latescibacterota bacterium]NIM65906.1 peptidyl-prolyl cis-trans isomerase [Candidatus Latescibacterota bacterium]NIO02651.1 peptidyl-prolyl cis-trans isomerase [Candidatus Latescibacterota bacterium]NIO29632.1 peptidyl-prolyl cis-trans isomerase [Candidatus Latescibacterota bacterium]